MANLTQTLGEAEVCEFGIKVGTINCGLHHYVFELYITMDDLMRV